MSNTDCGLFITRLGLGILFVIAGFGKLTGILGPGIDGFSGMVWGSVFLAWVIALAELLGGISLLTGLWTKWSSLGLAIIMVGALFIAHIPAFAPDQVMTVITLLLNLSVLTSLIGVMLTGPGKMAMGSH